MKVLQLNQAATCRGGDRFGPANDIEFGEDAFDMRLHGALTNKEGRADFFVAFSLSH